MFNILNFGLWAKISYGIVKMIFGTAMRVYDILLELARDSSVLNAVDITANLYVLAVVFMLFRVAIGLIKMLITPDAINDKQAGAGKMITRVVVSIIMLIVFSPTGILFDKNDGFLPRIEHALISDENSILYKAMSYEKVEKEQDEKKDELGRTIVNFSTIFPFAKYFYEDVYARANDDGTLTCWFYRAPVAFDKDNGGGTGFAFEVNPIKVTFSSEKSDKANTIKVKGDDSLTLYASFEESETEYTITNSETNEPINVTYDISPSKVKLEGKKEGKWVGIHGKIKNGPKMCGHWYMRKMYPNKKENKGWYLVYDKDKTQSNVYRGYSSIDAMLEQMSKDYDFEDKLSAEGKAKLSELGKAAIEANKTHYQKGYSEASLEFGTALISCFEECNDTDKEMYKECSSVKKNQFDTSETDEIAKYIKNERIDLSFMIATIVGVALVIYLIILCVDIVIRGLKLMLLESLAPIPIVSYVDPNDKIFKQWIKMLFSTYADLFIKIFAINVGVQLIKIVVNTDAVWGGNLFKQFLVLVGILVFVKMVPSFISKLFGIDSMGGSFKDILGMGKAALGFGAGAALGGITGFATGKGLGKISGLAKGLAMGAGSGAKGNMLGGAKGISAKNAKIKEGKANGLNFFERAAASVAGSVGYSPKQAMDTKIKKAVDSQQLLDDFRKRKDDVENMAEKFGPISDLKQQMLQGKISKDVFKDARDKYIAAAERGDKNFSYTYKDMNGRKHTVSHAIEDGDRSKVVSEIENIKVQYNSNATLRREIANANGGTEMSVGSYAEYKTAEGKATEQRNKYRDEITEVQNSPEYGRAKAMDAYSKTGN